METKRPRIAVFFGGQSPSRDLSCETGYWVCQYLPRASFDIVPVHVQADGQWQVPLGSLPREGTVQRMMTALFQSLRAVSPAEGWQRLLARPLRGIMSVIRGRGGDDGSLAAAGRLLKVGVAGATPEACVQTANKRLFSAAVGGGIRLPQELHVPATLSLEEAMESIRHNFVPPVFIKPVDQEGSVGVEEVTDPDSLLAAVRRAQQFGDVLAQERLAGTELSVSLTEDNHGRLQVLPVTIVTPRAATTYYDHLAKRRPGRVTLAMPEPRESAVLRQAEEIAREVYRRLGLAGHATVDMVADDNGVAVLEVNTVPTFTAATPLRTQLAAAHLPPNQFFGHLVANMLDRGF